MSTAQVAAEMPQRHKAWRVAAVLGLSLPIFAWVVSRAPLAQNLAYHDFADQRALFGVVHFWNVASNLPFAVIGALGYRWLMRAGRTSLALVEPSERIAYFVFFAGEFLTCFGSGYYHAGPANDTLVWDRLVFSLMLTSIFAIVVTEFISRRVGRLILAPMVLLGLFSVLYWARSESLGEGDLRLYFLVQFYPLLAIPAILLLFRSRYTHAGAFWVMWALYAVAKVAELYDGTVFEWSGFLSGHTVKHLVAAGASYVPLWSLQHRTHRAGGAGDVSDSHVNPLDKRRTTTHDTLSVKAIIVGAVIAVLGSTVALFGAVVLIALAASPVVFLVGLVLVLGFSTIGGFVVAHIAGRRELTHAAVTGLGFTLVSLLVYHGLEVGDLMGPVATALPGTPPWYTAAMYGLILLTVPVALVGGYLARVSRERPASNLLSCLTYGAMATWGVGETIDSTPALIGLLGPTFMVYSGGVWFLALLIAFGASIPLMFQGPAVHRRRVAWWYLLLVMVGLSGSLGIPRVAVESVAALIPIVWLVRSVSGEG